MQMKLIVRYLVWIVWALCVWVMMFGFDHRVERGNVFVWQVYAQSTSCDDGPNFTWCNGFCAIVTNSGSPNCVAYKESQQSKLSKLAGTMDQILSFLYLVMWPLLYVAWLAMDNTLIYGEWLGLTGLLYQFWTIMRTFSNYVIVFLLVRTIGKEMFKWNSWAKELGKAIAGILISGILINMSWFIIGAMVDVSTIATYGVWAIPLKLQTPGDDYCDDKWPSTKNLIENPKDIAKLWTCRPILATHGTMNLSDTFSADQAKWKVYYSYTPKNSPKQYFLSCPFKQSVLKKPERDSFYSGFQNQKVYNEWWTTGLISQMDIDAKKALSTGFCVVGTNQLLSLTGLNSESGIELYSTWYENAIVWWVTQLHNRDGMRVKNLVESNKGMIGVMYTMYGNMLWFANIKTDIQTNAPESQIIQFLVKIFFGFAIMFPLIALCVVLVMRVAVLWMVVWFSPLLVLWWTLKLMKVENSTLDSMMKWIWEKLTLANVVNLLFQPVMIVFTISMGMMFLDTLSTTIIADNGFGEALQCNMRASEQCCSIVSVMDICFEQVNAQVGTDAFFNYFTFTIINIIGVMILWFMVFAVMKSSKITESAVSKIQWLGRNILWSMPVVPWFDGGFVWFDGAKDGMSKAFSKVTADYEDTSGKTITEPWVDKISDKLTWAVWKARKEIVEVAGKDVDITKINDDASVRKTLGNNIIEQIGKAKDTVKHATANELLDTSDKKVAKLLDKYGAKDALSLFSNPQFLAETGQESKNMMKAFAVKNDKRVWAAASQVEYMKKLKEQTDAISGDKISLGDANIIRTTSGDTPWIYTVKKSSLPGKDIKDQYEVSFSSVKKDLSREESQSAIAAIEKDMAITKSQAVTLWFKSEFTNKWPDATDAKGNKVGWKDETRMLVDKDGKLTYELEPTKS